VTHRRLTVVVAAVALLAACRGEPKPKKRLDAGVAAAEMTGPNTKVIRAEMRSLPAPPVELPRLDSFKLVAAGRAPRKRLRYRWVDGAARQTIAEARVRSRRLTSGTWSPAVDSPPMREAIGVTVKAGTDGGATLYLRGVPAPADAGDWAVRWRTLVENKRAEAPIDGRGLLGKVVLAEDPTGQRSGDAVAEIAQRWLTAAVPLPVEAIGKGGRWRAVTVLRAGDAVVKQTADYTLVEAKKDAWVIDVDIRRTGEQQTVMPEGMPQGTLAELIALFRQVKGRVTVAPDLPWPTTGTVDAELRVHARLAVPGQPIAEQVTEDIGTIAFRLE